MQKLRWSFLMLLSAIVPAQAGIIAMTSKTGQQAYSFDPATGTATDVASGPDAQAWGAAYNPLASTLYGNDGGQLLTAAGYTGGALTPT